MAPERVGQERVRVGELACSVQVAASRSALPPIGERYAEPRAPLGRQPTCERGGVVTPLDEI